jgi:hypothetical protein
MVKYILTNEKYIGDSMMQKTYTPQTFPLRNIVNKGELDKYYVENTHAPIISKEDFKAVQEMFKKKAEVERKEATKRLLSRMIVCEECGWSYKYKSLGGIGYWVCSRKGNSGYECSGPNLSEKDIFDAFIRMYNKLRYFENEILDSTISLMEELRIRHLRENDEIRQIDIEISKLCEQNNRYEKYHERKIMDEISYMEQTSRLKSRLTELRSRRIKLISENENEQIVDKFRFLKDTLQEYPAAIIDFDVEMFEALVEKISVSHNGTLTFVLKGNLLLKEGVEVKRKCA